MKKQNSDTLLKNIKPDLLEKFLRLNRKHVAVYSVISLDPPIFYVPRFASKIAEFTDSFQMLFDRLRDKTAYFLYAHSSAVMPEDARAIAKLEEFHRRQYPKFNFIHLCNYEAQVGLLGSLGLKTLFFNINATVDEDIYKPFIGFKKKYDAVYDARLLRFKRHHLASQLRSLALIYYSVFTEDDPDYSKEIIDGFSRARFFNHDENGEYRRLIPEEVNRSLNQCRIGLCLSAEEGAMYSSVQYLLAGLPVVTTPSIGGRDVFFDDEVAIFVEPTPKAVKDGVREMINRNLAAEYVRAKTFEKIKAHREYFIKLVQDIYENEGVPRNFSDDWDRIFFNKLLRNQKHIETIEQLSAFGY